MRIDKILATLLCTLATLALADDAQMQRGAVLYQTKCLMCHQVSGQGVPPLYPPLAGSDWMCSTPARVMCSSSNTRGL